MKKYNFKEDGVTQGLLLMWMQCRKKTELFLQGYSPKEVTSESLNYGEICHAILEVVYKKVMKGKLTKPPSKFALKKIITLVERDWYENHSRPSRNLIEMVEKALAMSESVLSSYFKYWSKDDFSSARWRLVEKEFKVPYLCTTKKGKGIFTFLRGKIDGAVARKSLRLFETKTKSRINEINLLDTLWYNFQVRFYVRILAQLLKEEVTGCVYNVIRKTSLVQKANETLSNYIARVNTDLIKRPDFYFIRYELSINKTDKLDFEFQLQDIIREFYMWWKGILGTYQNTNQCTNEYGRCWAIPVCSYNEYSDFIQRDKIFVELGG